MKCSKCGETLVDVKKPCPQCGHAMTEQEDMDSIIKNILEEDTYTPKFEADKKSDQSEKNMMVTKPSNKVVEKKTEQKGQKVTKKKVTKQVTTKSKTSGKASAKDNGKKARHHKLGDSIVEGLRYLLVAVIVLFTISLFFNWLSLSGNAVNYGMLRSEEVKPFLQEGIREHSIESLESYEGVIVSFSAMDLRKFSQAIGDQYMTVVGPGGQDSVSLVAKMQKYYMSAMMLIIVINLISVAMVLIFRSLKGINIVRNFSMLNFAIIGLNYLALKVPYFSMIAVKAKDLLGQTMEHPQLSMTHNGITMNQSFYPYEVIEEQGFVFAILMLSLWLLVGIILSEVKNRREEIAIENGDV